MTTKIIVPELGPGVTQARVIKWLVTVGDIVKKFEPVVVVETEKATIEVSARVYGTIQELSVAEGSLVSAGTVLGSIQDAFFQDEVFKIHPQDRRFVRQVAKLGLLLILVLAGLALLVILLKEQEIGFLP